MREASQFNRFGDAIPAKICEFWPGVNLESCNGVQLGGCELQRLRQAMKLLPRLKDKAYAENPRRNQGSRMDA